MATSYEFFLIDGSICRVESSESGYVDLDNYLEIKSERDFQELLINELVRCMSADMAVTFRESLVKGHSDVPDLLKIYDRALSSR